MKSGSGKAAASSVLNRLGPMAALLVGEFPSARQVLA
jgi:hypothetical protein